MKRVQLLCLLLLAFLTPYAYAGINLEEDLDEDELIDIEESINRFEFFGDVQLRSDSVRDLPRPTQKDFDRVTSRARVGVLWIPQENIEFGLTGKINLSTQSNSKTVFNYDNEKADDISLDELYLNYFINDKTSIQIGQTHFPLQLSPMLWDADLRPQGLSISHRHEYSLYNSVELVGGLFLGNHLVGDDSNIKAIQAVFNFGEGKNTNYNIILSYLDFNNLGDLARNGLPRTNLVTAGGDFLNDFNNADVQVNLNLNQHSFPISAKINLTNNLTTGSDDFGARADLIFGDSVSRQGIEIGVAVQRVQREALVAAFNDDDWWFPTHMRGTGTWLAYGINESLRVKATVFIERRDNQAKNNKRALFDLQYSF